MATKPPTSDLLVLNGLGMEDWDDDQEMNRIVSEHCKLFDGGPNFPYETHKSDWIVHNLNCHL